MGSHSRKARRLRVEAGFSPRVWFHNAAEHCRTPKRRRDLARTLRACVLGRGRCSGGFHDASVRPNQESHQLPAVICEMRICAVAGNYVPGQIGIID